MTIIGRERESTRGSNHRGQMREREREGEHKTEEGKKGTEEDRETHPTKAHEPTGREKENKQTPTQNHASCHTVVGCFPPAFVRSAATLRACLRRAGGKGRRDKCVDSCFLRALPFLFLLVLRLSIALCRPSSPSFCFGCGKTCTYCSLPALPPPTLLTPPTRL